MKTANVTKGGVKMARSWPSSFLVCLWTKTEQTRKKGRGQYSAILTERARAIKDFIIWKRNFFYVTQRVIPGGQDSAILPAQEVNHSEAGFGSHCPVTKLAYNIPILVFSYFSKTSQIKKKKWFRYIHGRP